MPSGLICPLSTQSVNDADEEVEMVRGERYFVHSRASGDKDEDGIGKGTVVTVILTVTILMPCRNDYQDKKGHDD